MDYFRRRATSESMFSRMASSVVQFSKANLLLVNVASAMLCVLIADALVQLLHDKRKVCRQGCSKVWAYNFWRTVRLVIVAGFLGFISHKWYLGLDHVYRTDAVKDVAAKIVLDEVIMAPLVISSYIFAVGLLEGNNLSSVYEEWKQKFADIYQTDLFVWPGIQIINAMLVPIRFRLLYINLCSLMWNIYLSYCKHTKVLPKFRKLHVSLERPSDIKAFGDKEKDVKASSCAIS